MCEKVDKILNETEKLRKKYPHKKVDAHFLLRTSKHLRKVLQKLCEIPPDIDIKLE